MTFPTETARSPLWLLFQNAQKAALSVKSTCDRNAALMASANTPASTVLAILSGFKSHRGVFETARTAQGMGDWVKDAYADQAVDIVADFNAMVTALDNVLSWIVTNFPKDANNFILKDTIDAQGNVTERTFTPAQVSQLRTLLTTLSATIG